MDCEIDSEFPIELEIGNIGEEFFIDIPDISVYDEEQSIDIEPE